MATSSQSRTGNRPPKLVSELRSPLLQSNLGACEARARKRGATSPKEINGAMINHLLGKVRQPTYLYYARRAPGFGIRVDAVDDLVQEVQEAISRRMNVLVLPRKEEVVFRVAYQACLRYGMIDYMRKHCPPRLPKDGTVRRTSRRAHGQHDAYDDDVMLIDLDYQSPETLADFLEALRLNFDKAPCIREALIPDPRLSREAESLKERSYSHRVYERASKHAVVRDPSLLAKAPATKKPTKG